MEPKRHQKKISVKSSSISTGSSIHNLQVPLIALSKKEQSNHNKEPKPQEELKDIKDTELINKSLTNMEQNAPQSHKFCRQGKGKGKGKGNVTGKGKGKDSRVQQNQGKGAQKHNIIQNRTAPPENAPVLLYNEGVLAHKNGDLINAKRFFQLAKEKGHAKATHNLGVLCTEDPVQAYENFKTAAFKGVIEAQYILSILLREGKGCSLNEDESMKYLLRAASQGHAKANFELGLMYECGAKGAKGTDGVDLILAKKYYKISAIKEYTPACVNLARILEHSDNIEDQSEAYHWYEIACLKKDRIASYNLSMMYTFGIGNKNHVINQFNNNENHHMNSSLHVQKTTATNKTLNHMKAIEYLVISADLGHLKACYNLARRMLFGGGLKTFEVGGGIDYDPISAMKYLNISAQAGGEKAIRLMKFLQRKEKGDYLVQQSHEDESSLETELKTEKKISSPIMETESLYNQNDSNVIDNVMYRNKDLYRQSERELQQSMVVLESAASEEELLEAEIARISAATKARRAAVERDMAEDHIHLSDSEEMPG